MHAQSLMLSDSYVTEKLVNSYIVPYICSYIAILHIQQMSDWLHVASRSDIAIAIATVTQASCQTCGYSI